MPAATLPASPASRWRMHRAGAATQQSVLGSPTAAPIARVATRYERVQWRGGKKREGRLHLAWTECEEVWSTRKCVLSCPACCRPTRTAASCVIRRTRGTTSQALRRLARALRPTSLSTLGVKFHRQGRAGRGGGGQVTMMGQTEFPWISQALRSVIVTSGSAGPSTFAMFGRNVISVPSAPPLPCPLHSTEPRFCASLSSVCRPIHRLRRPCYSATLACRHASATELRHGLDGLCGLLCLIRFSHPVQSKSSGGPLRETGSVTTCLARRVQCPLSAPVHPSMRNKTYPRNTQLNNCIWTNQRAIVPASREILCHV